IVRLFHQQQRLGRGVGDRVDEGRARFGIVIDHLGVKRALPGRPVRPFGDADEAPLGIEMQARAETAVAFADQLGPAPPRAPELLLLAGIRLPKIDRDDHGLAPFVTNARGAARLAERPYGSVAATSRFPCSNGKLPCSLLSPSSLRFSGCSAS